MPTTAGPSSSTVDVKRKKVKKKPVSDPNVDADEYDDNPANWKDYEDRPDSILSNFIPHDPTENDLNVNASKNFLAVTALQLDGLNTTKVIITFISNLFFLPKFVHIIYIFHAD